MKAIAAIFFALISFKALAHPVMYQGGWALNSTNMSQYSNNYALYSFTNRFAAGFEHDRFDKINLGILKVNSLLWRDNGEDHQANVYLHSGIGFQDERKNPLVNFGLEGDWENRTLYTSLKHMQFENFSVSQGRVGISPAKAPFENLQTWFMVQAMVIHNVEDRVMITPMLRFFYQNVLWEMGSSTRGDWMLNLMVHY